MNRFTSPVKKIPGKNLYLPVILIYSSNLYKMKNYDAKFLFDTRYGKLGEYHLKLISEYLPHSDIISVVGHDLYKYKENVKIVENHNWESTSDIESVRLALNILPNAERALIILGETFFGQDDLNFKYGQSQANSYKDEYDEEIGFNIQNNCIETIAFEFKDKFGGILYLDNHEFKVMKSYASTRNSKCELYEFFGQIEKNRMKIRVSEASNKFLKISEQEELRKLL